jgi:DNA helicase HerA-like ATPase
MSNVICEFLATEDKISNFSINKYVKIICDSPEKNVFIGRIIEGPFFIPEEVGRDSAIAQTSILRGEQFLTTPSYYLLGRIELLGEYSNGTIIQTGKRPTPKSRVEELELEEVEKIVGINGNLFLGRLKGYKGVNIKLDENSKKVLPRNIGIFGTVGSGKSNTAQVIMEEAANRNYAVIVIDVEGEYVNMDKPTSELVDLLKEYKMKPEGVKNFKVFYPAPGEEPEVKGAKKIDVKYENFDDYILFEILSTSEAQERAFMEVLDEIEKIKQRAKVGRGPLAKRGVITIEYLINQIREKMEKKEIRSPTGAALISKLRMIERLKIFDQEGVEDLDPTELLVPGQVSVIDVSTVVDTVKNIIIVDLLNKIFEKKVKDLKAPKTLIVIEEAHTFISKEARARMEATMDMLKIIARRGRKKWLCLCFISQQPSHLPDEIFELCNTRIIHTIKSESNVDAIKRTTGGVTPEVLNVILSLGIGDALIVTPQFNHPLVVEIRPTKSARRFVE